jgi:hypothetical protein
VESAEQHGVRLCANTLDWLLARETLPHRGLKAVLTAARTQLTAAETLLKAPAIEEEP